MDFDVNDMLNTIGKMRQHEKEITSGSSNNIFKNEKFWTPEIPDKGKNTFRIRPLPIVIKKAPPYQLLLNHTSIKGLNGWINEFCPETFLENKNACPICNVARKLYATNDPTDEAKASKLWRKKSWVCNILVVKDSRNNNANEGKVFMYKYGIKIYNKFNTALFPEEDSGDTPLMFYHPNEGYDFNLVCKRVSEWPNYDDSQFVRDSTPIANSDKEMKKILESVYDIESEILDPSNFKSIEELEKIVKDNILGEFENSSPTKKAKTEDKQSIVEDFDISELDDDDNEEKVEVTNNDEDEEDDDFLSALEDELNDDIPF